MPTGKYVRYEEVRTARAELVRNKWANGDYANRKKYTPTDEHRKRMAESARRNFEGKRDGLLGKPRPEEIKMKISQTKIGVALDAEGRKKRTLEKVAEYQRKTAGTVRSAIYRRYRAKHRNEIKERFKERCRNDESFRLTVSLREAVRRALKGKSKSARTLELLGCSVEYLKQHLEAQFRPGMNWSNYGFWGWHIDHIKPCASFDFRREAQQRECFHFTNLQPLWRIDNLRKGSRIERVA